MENGIYIWNWSRYLLKNRWIIKKQILAWLYGGGEYILGREVFYNKCKFLYFVTAFSEWILTLN